jgi:hypothetical protein
LYARNRAMITTATIIPSIIKTFFMMMCYVSWVFFSVIKIVGFIVLFHKFKNSPSKILAFLLAQGGFYKNLKFFDLT